MIQKYWGDSPYLCNGCSEKRWEKLHAQKEEKEAEATAPEAVPGSLCNLKDVLG